MEHTGLINKIEELTKEELEHAKKKFPPIHSAHEGYAIILEEYEEFLEELNSFQIAIDALWNATKLNDDEMKIEQLEIMDKVMSSMIKEGVQVKAMCQRMRGDLFK